MREFYGRILGIIGLKKQTMVAISAIKSAMKKVDSIAAWKLVASCEKTGSLLKASLLEGMDFTVASRAISALERELGVKLLDRSTRPAGFTPAFRRLAPFARKITRGQHELLREAGRICKEQKDAESAPRRTVRVSIPSNLNRQELTAALLAFEERHPFVKIEATSDGGLRSLLDGSVDIAIYGRRPREVSIYAETSYVRSTFLMATHAFVRRYGLPRTVEDLPYFRLALRNPENLSFSRTLWRGEESYYIPEGPNLIYGDASTCCAAMLSGNAISVDVSIEMVEDELARGLIVPVLPGWQREPWDTCVCTLLHHSRDPLIRSLMTALRKSMAGMVGRLDAWYERLGIASASRTGAGRKVRGAGRSP